MVGFKERAGLESLDVTSTVRRHLTWAYSSKGSHAWCQLEFPERHFDLRSFFLFHNLLVLIVRDTI